MKTIQPMLPEAERLCASQKRKSGKTYRLTRHCLAVPCEDGTLLYHTLNGSLVLLEAGERAEDHMDTLLPAWFFVPEDYDENKQSRDLRALLRRLAPPAKHKTAFTILPTTDCNARCAYCFEMGDRRVSMSEQTARDTAAYIARVCGGKPVKLHWFGGEPLYNRRAIEIICAELRAAGIAFTSRMTSNAFYLDQETVETAGKDWNLKQVQITLDGTQEVYDRVKAYTDRGEESPFERVIRNIRFALDAGLEVTIVLNMEQKNAENLSLLVDELAARFGGQEKLTVRLSLLHEIKGKISRFESEQGKTEKVLSLSQKIDKAGFATNVPLERRIRFISCMADNPACEVILPDGRVNRCEHPTEGESVGTIYSDARDEAITASWREHIYYPACEPCALYPCCTNTKKCEHNQNGCPESEMQLKKHFFERSVLAAYHEWKSKPTEETP